jgi:hypothetical protein
MSFNDKIMAIADRIPQIMDNLETEEATKNAITYNILRTFEAVASIWLNDKL